MKKYKFHFPNPIKSTKPKSQKTDAFWVRTIGSGILDVWKVLKLVHKNFFLLDKIERGGVHYKY